MPSYSPTVILNERKTNVETKYVSFLFMQRTVSAPTA